MKKHWKLMLMLSVICAALLIPTSVAMAAPAQVIVSGPVSGTIILDIDLSDTGISLIGKETVTGGQSTHGSYLSPDGTLYIDGFAGGGVQIFKKVGGAWALQKTVPAARAKMMCSFDLKDGSQDPNTGLVGIGDIATGFQYYLNMATGDWAAKDALGLIGEAGLLGGAGTTCDTSYRETPLNGEAWSSGHTNHIYHWTAPYASNPITGDTIATLDIPGTRLNENKLGHQNRTFKTPDGTEYVVVSDGSAGDLIFIRTSDNVLVKRVHMVDGENHSMGITVDGPLSNTLIDGGLAVIPNFVNGDLMGVKLLDANGNLDPVVTGVISGADINGGLAADICGADIVSYKGSWMRN